MTLIEPPAPLLRNQFGASPQISGTSGSAAQLSAESLDAKTCGLSAVASGTASAEDGGRCLAVLKEDGITRFATAVYHHASSPVAFQAFALEFGDATGAFSAYTFYRSLMHAPKVRGPEARLGKGSSETSVDAEGTLGWAGTAVLKVTGQVSSTELTTLVAALPKNGGRRGLAPLLPTLLPGPAVEAGSIRYAIGPAGYQAMGGALPSAILGWDKSAEVLTADFSGKPGKGTLTLLLYPTPQIAGDRGRAIEKAVNDLGPAKFGTVKLLRVGPLLGMTSGAWTPEEATALLAGLHLNQEVSFDQKLPLEFHAEVRKTATLLQSIAIFTGVLILAAVVLGVFLGGARAAIRVLQGKPAAHEPEFLTIDLRGRPKALVSVPSVHQDDERS